MQNVTPILEQFFRSWNILLTKTSHNINQTMLSTAIKSIPKFDHRLAINQPMGNFFYDPWELNQTYKGTIWETIYNSLPMFKGEARFIQLESGTGYFSHADIDDRWHLNLTGNQSYLIDLETSHMHLLTTDGYWYFMDAGRIHSASNYGQIPRIQLVVRKLLSRGNIYSAVKVTITPAYEQFDYRYQFDNIISPWLNRANKQNVLDQFSYQDTLASFVIDRSVLEEFKSILTKEFDVRYG